MLALSLMASIGCPPNLVLYREQAMSRPLQDLPPLFPNAGARQVIAQPSILTLMPNEQDDLFKSTSECNQFFKRPILRKIPLPLDRQDMPAHSTLWSLQIDEQWAKQKEILRYLVDEDDLDPSLLPELMGLPAIPIVPQMQHVASSDSDFINYYGEKASLCQPNVNNFYQETDPDMFHDLPSAISAHTAEQLPFHGIVTDMMDLASVLEEFALRKGTAHWRKKNVLIPYFRWNDTIDQDLVYPSALKLDAIAAAPLKSPEEVKLKPMKKRKNKKSTLERDLYRSNSFHACESLLSLMMDKKRNGKSVMNSLKKSGPELPQLLTQVSATIAGTGLAVIFSIIYRTVCGTVPGYASNLLTTGFGIGLFSVCWAVNKLRDTIIYIGKNSAKSGFREEEMMMRVDKSVSDICFRAAASMVMLMLWFA